MTSALPARIGRRFVKSDNRRTRSEGMSSEEMEDLLIEMREAHNRSDDFVKRLRRTRERQGNVRNCRCMIIRIAGAIRWAGHVTEMRHACTQFLAMIRRTSTMRQHFAIPMPKPLSTPADYKERQQEGQHNACAWSA